MTVRLSPVRATASVPRVDAHEPRGSVRASRRSRWRIASLVGVHVLVLVHLAHWKLSGTTLSPVEPSEARETLELGYVNAGFVLLALALVSTLVFGRFFCGWACHVVAYQDASAWLLGRVGLRPRPVRSRALLALPVLAALDMFALPPLVRWLEEDGPPSLAARFLTDDLWATFPGPAVALATLAVDGFLVVWFLGAKGFCTYGCPYGALFGALDRFAKGRIRVTDACEQCGHCTVACTSNVRVHEEVAHFGRVVDAGCMKCMDCVSVCPKEALYFGLRERGGRANAASERSTRSPRAWDFTWREEVGLLALALLGVLAFRGLYHTIPFMLALGLGVVFAASVVVLVRLVRERDFVLQDRALRSDGRWTLRGRALTIGCVLFVALTAHSAVVRGATLYGGWAVARAGSLERGVPEHRDDGAAPSERARLIDRASFALELAGSLGLVADPEVELHLGSIDLDAGRYASARDRFRRAIELEPRMQSPHLGLAEAAIQLGELDTASVALRDLLALAPDHVRGRWRLAQLHILRDDLEAAEPVLEGVVADDPSHAGARRDLERVRAVLDASGR